MRWQPRWAIWLPLAGRSLPRDPVSPSSAPTHRQPDRSSRKHSVHRLLLSRGAGRSRPHRRKGQGRLRAAGPCWLAFSDHLQPPALSGGLLSPSAKCNGYFLWCNDVSPLKHLSSFSGIFHPSLCSSVRLLGSLSLHHPSASGASLWSPHAHGAPCSDASAPPSSRHLGPLHTPPPVVPAVSPKQAERGCCLSWEMATWSLCSPFRPQNAQQRASKRDPGVHLLEAEGLPPTLPCRAFWGPRCTPVRATGLCGYPKPPLSLSPKGLTYMPSDTAQP